jgi:plastocyanin
MASLSWQGKVFLTEGEVLIRFRTLILLAAVIAGALALSAPSQAALPKLTGTVGPGFTITLTRLGKKVTTAKAVRYSITVADKSNIHNFRLIGPGVNREITTIGFVGTKTVIVKLKKGTYRFICDPHATIMKGSFKVL